MAGVDDIIGNWVRKAERTGELKNGKFWGKPLDLNDGFEQTPEKQRMAYKVLKNAGYQPWEVETMARIAELREALEAADNPEREALQKELSELRQKLALRLERNGR